MNRLNAAVGTFGILVLMLGLRAEAVEIDPKLGRYVKKQSPGKSTKNWSLDEIQAEFGYKF